MKPVQLARMIKDYEYHGVTHKKGTGWVIDGKDIFIKKNKVMILAGHGEHMDLEIGKDVVIENVLYNVSIIQPDTDVCPYCKREM